jgi:hypothetical protein
VATISEVSPRFVLFQSSVSAETRDEFDHGARVLIEDHFVQRNNADYPASETFSDRHLGTMATNYEHFGDYSIVGDIYKESGGLPMAVAIHYMASRGTGRPLDLHHYVSDQVETRGNVEEKFLEAVNKLIAEIPSLGAANRTSATEEFEHLHATRHAPHLGVLKKLGLKQHFELILRLT